jgi:hypothetical protein
VAIVGRATGTEVIMDRQDPHRLFGKTVLVLTVRDCQQQGGFNFFENYFSLNYFRRQWTLSTTNAATPATTASTWQQSQTHQKTVGSKLW